MAKKTFAKNPKKQKNYFYKQFFFFSKKQKMFRKQIWPNKFLTSVIFLIRFFVLVIFFGIKYLWSNKQIGQTFVGHILLANKTLGKIKSVATKKIQQQNMYFKKMFVC